MILVTGATGLLGSRLLYDLVNSGQRVRAIRRLSSRMNCVDYYLGSQPELLQKVEWAEADLLDLHSIEELMLGIDYVYHCAGKVSFHPSDHEIIHRINVQGTANLVNQCIASGIKKMCHVSSVAALGRTGTEEVITEDVVWKTSRYNTTYALSKYGAELEVWRGIAEGLNAVIVNPGLIIGPGNYKTDSSMIYKQVWKGLPFYTDGVAGLVDVADVSEIMIRLMNSDVASERFTLVSESVPLKLVMERIADKIGKKRPGFHAGPMLVGLAWRVEYFKSLFTGSKPVITRETAISAQGKNYYSNEKIKNVLNFKFIDVMESIDKTAYDFLMRMNK